MGKESLCIIIGAGPAGLTAGYKLLQLGKGQYEVIILEESDVVGGIARTICHNGNRMDLGGHRFFSKSPEVNSMWQELMPQQGAPAFDDLKLGRNVKLFEGGPNPEVEDNVLLNRRRFSRIFYHNNFYDYPVKFNLNIIGNMGWGATICACGSYLKAMFNHLPETSLENFYINRFGRKLYSIFFEGYTEKLWGRHPRNISADWGVQRIKGVSITTIFINFIMKMLPDKFRKNTKNETSLIESFMYPKLGPGQLWSIAANRFVEMGGKIIFKAKAKAMKTINGRIHHVQYEHAGIYKKFDCDYVISSMPLKDLIEGISSAPEDIRCLAASLPYRDFVTVGLLLDQIQLKNKTNLKTLNNIVPDCWIYVQDTRVRLGRIQIFNNWSPYMVQSPENTIWIGLEYFCNEGDGTWELSENEWKEKGISELIAIGVLDKAPHVLDFHVEKVKKAYPAYFETYSRIDELVAYLDSIPNLYCVGRNGQHRYNNMDHSMMTSFEAVRNILAGGQSDKSAIWNVNTEREYQEEK